MLHTLGSLILRVELPLSHPLYLTPYIIHCEPLSSLLPYDEGRRCRYQRRDGYDCGRKCGQHGTCCI